MLFHRELRSERSQVVDRRAKERVAQVEEAGPERGAVGRTVEAGGIGKALESSHEHRELEIHGGDAVRARMDAGAVENRAPLDELSCPRPAIPRAAFCAFRLELEQVPRERCLEACERGLDAVGGVPQGCLARAGCRWQCLTAIPPLEQPAERERGDLAGAELGDQPTRRQLAPRMQNEDIGPACSRSGAGKAGTSAPGQLRQACAA